MERVYSYNPGSRSKDMVIRLLLQPNKDTTNSGGHLNTVQKIPE